MSFEKVIHHGKSLESKISVAISRKRIVMHFGYLVFLPNKIDLLWGQKEDEGRIKIVKGNQLTPTKIGPSPGSSTRIQTGRVADWLTEETCHTVVMDNFAQTNGEIMIVLPQDFRR